MDARGSRRPAVPFGDDRRSKQAERGHAARAAGLVGRGGARRRRAADVLPRDGARNRCGRAQHRRGGRRRLPAVRTRAARRRLPADAGRVPDARHAAASSWWPICREGLWENLRFEGARKRASRASASACARRASTEAATSSSRSRQPPRCSARPRPEDDAALALAEILAPQWRRGGGGGELALRPSARRTFVGSVRLARLLAFRCWRVEATLQTSHVRSFGVRSELCFCVADRGGLSESLSGAPFSGRPGVRCVPCGTETRWRGRARPAETWSRRPPSAPSIYV